MQLSKVANALLGRDNSDFLGALLERADPTQDFDLRMLWLERIGRWLVERGSRHSATRAKYMMMALERNPVLATRCAKTLLSIVEESGFITLFTQSGLSGEKGLFSDLIERLLNRILPRPADMGFDALVRAVIRNERDVEALTAVPQLFYECILRLIRDCDRYQPAIDYLRKQVEDARRVLATRISYLGMSPDIVVRTSGGSKTGISGSAHWLLAKNLHQSNDPSESAIEACRQHHVHVYRHMESSGTSVELVHRLEVLDATLDQLEMLNRALVSGESKNLSHELRGCLLHLAHVAVRGRSLRDHLRHQIYYVSRKIVERTGSSGDHAVARSAVELRKLFVSALGAGVIVVIMTLAKLCLSALHAVPLLFGLGVFVVYSAGFLAMQFTGCVLATKLPSFTASHLAALMRKVRAETRTRVVADEFKWVARSQLYALAGNLVAVVPVALAATWGLRQIGLSPMSAEYAQHSLHDLHAWRTPAILLGALTGVELWVSSLCGGWFENFVVFRKIPESIARHTRLRSAIGDLRAKSLGELFLKHSSAFAANVSLAFFFGFVPIVGQILGVNADGKHVTISSSLGIIAGSVSGWNGDWRFWLPLALGLFLIGCMNLVVSFSCALWVAARAQNVRPERLVSLWGEVRNKIPG